MPVFDDAVFLWDPGDAVTASSDLVSGASAAGTTEGSIVTTDGHVGRANVGAVASNFDLDGTPPAPFTNVHPNQNWSAFAVSRIGATGFQEALWFGEAAQDDRYAQIRTRRGTTGESSVRLDSFTPHSDTWPFVDTPDVGTSGAFVVSIITFQVAGATNSHLRAYQDSATLVDEEEMASFGFPALPLTRIRIGGQGDSTPNNSTAGEVYAAGIWDRMLTDIEIDEILADPFAYLAGPETLAYSSCTATRATVNLDAQISLAARSVTSTRSASVLDTSTALACRSHSATRSQLTIKVQFGAVLVEGSYHRQTVHGKFDRQQVTGSFRT